MTQPPIKFPDGSYTPVVGTMTIIARPVGCGVGGSGPGSAAPMEDHTQ